MKIQLMAESFDPWQEIAGYQLAQTALQSKSGAASVFVGILRDFNQGVAVTGMTLEHYPGMTEKHLRRVGDEAAARWPLLDVLLVHRYGEINLSEAIVLVAVWSAHRDAAFAACRYIIDELKTRAPFWKHETTHIGQQWVAQEK